MSNLSNAEKIGVRDKETKKLIAVYPFKGEGNDEEITKKVTDWFYMQDCSSEELLKNAYVDVLTDAELKANK